MRCHQVAEVSESRASSTCKHNSPEHLQLVQQRSVLFHTACTTQVTQYRPASNMGDAGNLSARRNEAGLTPPS
ncbi:hypothetical protein [Kribbella sp. CA-293567]|uniref:hypothetical protein n=1 Tax=Kribbella sp. CA-293567 TaxID=3002436 RepID=UPI0022DD1A04|nr:hypothetical protein [Kribbella sp. CA-293567]WBQ04351.1 hypothetical protein OX958_30845 [Kribbella sp. CA-293567]